MKNFLTGLFGLVMVPLFIINAFGGIVALIWLIIEKEWNLVITGVIAFFGSTLLLGIAFLPALGLQALGAILWEKNIKVLSFPILVIALLINIIIISLWVGVVYLYGYENYRSSTSLIPVSLWCYGVAVAPIVYMASKEPPDNVTSNVMAFFTSIGCLWITISTTLFNTNLISAYFGFLISIAICLIVIAIEVISAFLNDKK